MSSYLTLGQYMSVYVGLSHVIRGEIWLCQVSSGYVLFECFMSR